MAQTPYPVRLESRLDPRLSRWLWLVKWLLAVPHYLVLAVLWVAFVVLTVAAFFAVLVTGRYPASLFSCNVGVLRWTWRVAHYSYGALGTDRYPPFTLEDVPDHPARLDVAYPERLSRGLVLVKWWLLALPHYLVLGFLVGGGSWLLARSDTWPGTSGSGLIGVLVLIAGVLLAVTGRYPQGLYDLVVGLQRWVFRVVAYAALMTDQYPPFRLDLGGPEPGPVPAQPTGGPLPVSPTGGPLPVSRTGGSVAVPPATGRWTGGRVTALVAGALLILASVGLLSAGGAALWTDQTQRDSAGYVTTPARQLSTPTAGLLVSPLDVELDGPDDALWLQRTLGAVRVQVSGQGDRALFVGLAPADAVDRYLDGVAVDRVRGVDAGDDVSYQRRQGSSVLADPAAQPFWTASATGVGPLELTWDAEDGRWAVLVAAADGSPGVVARARVGAELPVLTGLSAGLLAVGAVLLAAGLALVLGAVSAVRRSRYAPVQGVPEPRTPATTPTPTREPEPASRSGSPGQEEQQR